MLARPMSAAKDRTATLAMALSRIARQNVLERVSFATSFKSTSVNWPGSGIFVGVRFDPLGRCRTRKDSTLKASKVPESNERRLTVFAALLQLLDTARSRTGQRSLPK